MVVVAAVALLTAGGMYSVRLYRLSRLYRRHAAEVERLLIADQNSQRRWLLLRQSAAIRVRELEALKHMEGWPELEDPGLMSDLEREEALQQAQLEQIEQAERRFPEAGAELNRLYLLKQKYQRATRYPWLPTDPELWRPE